MKALPPVLASFVERGKEKREKRKSKERCQDRRSVTLSRPRGEKRGIRVRGVETKDTRLGYERNFENEWLNDQLYLIVLAPRNKSIKGLSVCLLSQLNPTQHNLNTLRMTKNKLFLPPSRGGGRPQRLPEWGEAPRTRSGNGRTDPASGIEERCHRGTQPPSSRPLARVRRCGGGRSLGQRRWPGRRPPRPAPKTRRGRSETNKNLINVLDGGLLRREVRAGS